MLLNTRYRKVIAALTALSLLVISVTGLCLAGRQPIEVETASAGTETGSSEKTQQEKTYIKWVDFTPTCAVMEQALNLDVDSYGKEPHYHWIELLAYAAAKTGGKFTSKKNADIEKLVTRIQNGESMEKITEGLKYYPYYLEAYTAVLAEFVGEYKIEVDDPDHPGEKKTETRYGLKNFLPIAKGYGYSEYDDFGSARSYGYKRVHLGHDMMGSVGTPVIAVEGGVVEALGWNQYGGWRIGIRSHDGKRYYYYAHLRRNHPFVKTLEVGDIVKAGDVIGYLGMTGYSTKENVNNIKTPHLHFGMQLIFDESQKDGTNQIWIDVYQIVKLLRKNRSAVVKDPETKDYSRVYDMVDIQPTGGGETGIEVPILMYHSLLKDPSKAGPYTLSPDVLEQDMRYLLEHGYTTIFVSDLINYVYDGTPLPAKPVLLTFDDGYYNNLTYLLPLLVKYDMKAVVSVIGSYTEQFSSEDKLYPAYSYLTWDNIRELSGSGHVEIQNHSYSLHENALRKGSMRMRGESIASYQSMLSDDLMRLQDSLTANSGVTPTAYTYPFGFYSKETQEILKQLGFKAALLCYERVNRITRDPECLFQLGRFNRPSGISTWAFMKKALGS